MPLSTDSGFERAFADLAHAEITDRVPGLLDYMLGFQVLDVNDDQTRAAGIFGYQVNDELMYIPVFFMSAMGLVICSQ